MKIMIENGSGSGSRGEFSVLFCGDVLTFYSKTFLGIIVPCTT